MSRHAKPKRRTGVWVAAAAGALTGLYLVWVLLIPAGSPRVTLVEFAPGTSAAVIAGNLESAGLIRSAFWFRVLARVTGRPLLAGEYGFRRASLLRVLHALQAGRVYLHRVLVREGDALPQIADALAREGLAADSMRTAAMSRPLLRKLGIPGPSAEGFLFPDTYLIPKSFTGEQIVAMMARRFSDRVPKALLEEAKARGLDVLRLVTLASIVEKEARDPGERPVIAGVFRNRLKRGMPLQADPTVLYGLNRWDARLTLKDLQVDHPYNTYRRRGLPPGPICSPGLACLEAAASPAEVPFLYFVTRKDGTGRHQFSRTLAEHERAIKASKLRAAAAPRRPASP
ncbi:MAG: endolytic transglycosylase MltG [Candidatus Coatesbacteria bacterium]